MRIVKCIKVDFYAIGKEHIAYVDLKDERINEINEMVSSIWETAKVTKVETVEVPASEYKVNHIDKLEQWLSALSIYK